MGYCTPVSYTHLVYANSEIQANGIYNPTAYYEMIQVVEEIAEKWGIGFLNMWDDPDMQAVSDSDWSLYMSDTVHPTKAGYLLWWTPKFQEFLYTYFE